MTQEHQEQVRDATEALLASHDALLHWIVEHPAMLWMTTEDRLLIQEALVAREQAKAAGLDCRLIYYEAAWDRQHEELAYVAAD